MNECSILLSQNGDYSNIFLSNLTIVIPIAVSIIAIGISISLSRKQQKIALFEKRYELFSFADQFVRSWFIRLQILTDEDDILRLFTHSYTSEKIQENSEYKLWQEVAEKHRNDLELFSKIPLLFKIDDKHLAPLLASYAHFYIEWSEVVLKNKDMSFPECDFVQARNAFYEELQTFDQAGIIKKLKREVTLQQYTE